VSGRNIVGYFFCDCASSLGKYGVWEREDGRRRTGKVMMDDRRKIAGVIGVRLEWLRQEYKMIR
jgi:hypothetical protein